MSDPKGVTTTLIDPALKRQDAIISALLSTAYVSIALIADGHIWEGENINIPHSAKPHAEKMAILWERTARHLEARELAPRHR